MASKYSRQPGDSILALLEPGEYVLNRNAVNEIGKENLDELNFEDSPRFNMAQRSEMQLGGMLGDYIGMQTGGSMQYGETTTDLPTFPYLYFDSNCSFWSSFGVMPICSYKSAKDVDAPVVVAPP